MYSEVCVICPIHGEFLVKPIKHLYRKQGCNKCIIKGRKKHDLKVFLERAKKVHR